MRRAVVLYSRIAHCTTSHLQIEDELLRGSDETESLVEAALEEAGTGKADDAVGIAAELDLDPVAKKGPKSKDAESEKARAKKIDDDSSDTMNADEALLNEALGFDLDDLV